MSLATSDQRLNAIASPCSAAIRILIESFSMALRSALTLVGALVMMFITNLKLSLIIAIGVPLVLLPILFFGWLIFMGYGSVVVTVYEMVNGIDVMPRWK